MDYQNWLAQVGVFRCVLVELDYLDAGTVKTAYFSNAAFVSAGSDSPAHTAYDPFVLAGLEFDRSLAEIFTGASSVRTSDVELVSLPATQWLVSAKVAGQQIRVFLGDKAWPKAQFQQIITGVCDGVWPEQERIRIQFRDAARQLQQPALTERYISGAAEGELTPLCLGRCYNIKPVLIDAANHVYQFNCVPSQAVTAVRFNGAVVDAAQYVIDLAAGTIAFNTYPIGEVTADVDGAVITGQWLQTAADFIQYLLSRLSISADISGLPGYLLGLYLTDDTDADVLLDEICASVGGYWLFDRTGQFRARHFNGIPVTKSAQITDDQNLYGTRLLRRRITPLYSYTIGYARNWQPLSSIAASIYENDPAEAKRLATTEQTVTITSSSVEAEYADAETVTASTLIVTKADAETEANRRMALAAVPRYVYETQQLASPFAWDLGAGCELDTQGVNGEAAVLTRLSESPLTGLCTVEYWQ